MRRLATTLLGSLRALSHRSDGATAVEYGLIAAIIATALIAGLVPLSASINTTFRTVSNTLDTPDATPAEQ